MQRPLHRLASRLQAQFNSGLITSRQNQLSKLDAGYFTAWAPLKACNASKAISTAASPSRSTTPKTTTARNRIAVSLGFAGCALGAVLWSVSKNVEAESALDNSPMAKKIRLQEVKEHDQDASRIWVHRGAKVYDITDFVPNHPGGAVIVRAAGGSIDPFWKIFSIHQKQDVYDILEEYLIGEIDARDLVDGKVPEEHIEDPFKDDPHRDSSLYQHTSRPCNAETPGAELDSYLTPNRTFFVRNHMWVPTTEAKKHKLTIELTDGTEVEYTMEDLRQKFKEHTITAALQCSGNRRSHMTASCPEGTNGLQWGVGAIGNAEWTGVLLRDVLKDAGVSVDNVPEDIKHAQFSGSEAYGASIPICKAVDPRGDVLLAYKMNGEILPRDHGYPLRVLVPGHVAARSVKWLTRIVLSDEESWSQWQRKDYKCFGPNVGRNPDWDSAVAIQETPVQSAVTMITEKKQQQKKKTVIGVSNSNGGSSNSGKTTDGNNNNNKKEKNDEGEKEETVVTIDGYAFAGGGRRIVRVDVSADGGKTWDQAEFIDSDDDDEQQQQEQQRRGSKAWAWQRWTYQLPKDQITGCLTVKAVDDAYNTQPDSFDSLYNFRGNLATAWHRVPTDVALAQPNNNYSNNTNNTNQEAVELERKYGKKA